MATIEERAYAAIGHPKSPDTLQTVFLYPKEEQTFFRGYIKGAKEQKQIDIDRVCEWLETHLPYYCDEFDESYTAEVISDLREEMTKEK